MISFDVKLTPRDLYRFNMIQAYTGTQGGVSVVLAVLCAAMSAISFHAGNIGYGILYLAAAALMVFYIPMSLWLRAKSVLRTNAVLAGTLHYEITAERIHVQQGEETGDLDWAYVYKLVSDKKQVRIYTSRKNAYIIPREQLGGQYAALRALAEEKLERYRIRMRA